MTNKINLIRVRVAIMFLLISTALFNAQALAGDARYDDGRTDEMRGNTYRLITPIVCKDTKIKSISGRFGDAYGKSQWASAGTRIIFSSGLGVVSYSLNRIVDRERVGDRVQACFLGRVVGATNCDPVKDARGYVYRLYDYRLHAAYVMMNSQHACGGA